MLLESQPEQPEVASKLKASLPVVETNASVTSTPVVVPTARDTLSWASTIVNACWLILEALKPLMSMLLIAAPKVWTENGRLESHFTSVYWSFEESPNMSSDFTMSQFEMCPLPSSFDSFEFVAFSTLP